MGIIDLQNSTDIKTGIWGKPGWWFWLAILLGLTIRVYLVCFTEGTYDAKIWQSHAEGIHKEGLIGYYRTANKDVPPRNHPPFLGMVLSWLWDISQATGIAFVTLLRAPFILLDGGSTLLLLNLFRNNRYRFLIGAGYWLHPLAMIFSSFHGNTDSAIAFFLLLALWLLSKEKTIWAAVALGASFWIKLSGLMAIPAFVFFVRGWRKQMLFLLMIGVAAISTYVPSLLIDPLTIYKNVFAYHGQVIKTASGIPLFGTCIFIVPFFKSLSPEWQIPLARPLTFFLVHSWLISLVLIFIFSWLRRSCTAITQLGATIAAVYAILYGISNYWAFQYFAWSIPFWFFTRRWFLISATILAGGYIYSLYWMLCGNPWLLGTWDFVPHPQWPLIIILLRNLATLFFFISAFAFLVSAVYEKIVRRPAKDNSKQITRRSRRPLKT